MEMRTAGRLAWALAMAGWLSVPAWAGDDPAPGETPKPGGEAKCGGDPACRDAGKCGDCKDGGECKACAEGAKEGKECCALKAALQNLRNVALAAVEGESEAAKAVLAEVPEKAREKVEEMRKATFEFLVRVQKEADVLRKDFAEACRQAKAEGCEVACDLKATCEKDLKALHEKGREKLDAFAKTLDETLGSEKVQALAAEAKKVGEAAKACASKVKAAAARLLATEEKKTEETPEEAPEDEPAPAPAGKDCKGGS